MMRNRFAFYALFPLVAFTAFVIPAKWLVMLGLISIGMFPLSLIIGIAFLPVFFALLVCCSVGIVSLWISLRWERKLARLIGIAPLGFIPICIYLSQFLAKITAQQDANYLFLYLDVLALQAHLLYPALAIVLAVLVWTRKAINPDAPVDASTIGQTLLMWCAILAFWALAVFTLLSTREPIKQYLDQIRIDSEHVIESDNSNPIVTAVCAGQVAQADKLITEKGKGLGAGDIDHLIGSCLKKRIGDPRTNEPPPFYGDRVGVSLKAILSYEKANGVSVQNGCSPYRSLLLKEIYRNNIDERGLSAFQQMDLPVNCPIRFNDGSYHPVWWNVIYSSPTTIITYDKLNRLEKIGISLLETDSHGNQFFSSNWNGFCDYTDDSALLHLIERGVSTSFIESDTSPLSIELLKRRFGYRRDDTKTDDIDKLLEVVGEPDLPTLLDAKKGRWWSFPSRKEDEPNSIALHDYLDKRIAELEGQKQNIKKRPTNPKIN
ncbi:hypothetical protein [Undibacterium sp. Di24W]|uniref:hypothetical protein n=1 Tax=Undibacterium sp. Di24W TaxID=3413033 RepID=UPI003BF193A3